MMAGGYALCEDQPMDQGKILNPSLADYKVIHSLDMPKTEIIEVDTYEPEGPFGAKEAGEGLTNPTAGAIANAVRNAVGVTVTSLPLLRKRFSGQCKRRKQKRRRANSFSSSQNRGARAPLFYTVSSCLPGVN